MADITMKASKRTEFGKGAARRARRDGLTPAVIYAGGSETMHLLLPAKELFLALRTANALFELTIEGEAKPVLALPKQIQRDPIFPVIEHVDFLLVRADEKVSVEVPVIVTGEPESGLVINQDLNTLSVLAPAVAIPSEFEVSVEGMQLGDSVVVSQIALPADVEAEVDGETLVVSIVAPTTEGGAEAESADSEGAEGEGDKGE